MARKIPDPTGKCPVCDINLFGPEKKPMVMPCGVGLARSEPEKCPFETEEEQKAIGSAFEIISGENTYEEFGA